VGYCTHLRILALGDQPLLLGHVVVDTCYVAWVAAILQPGDARAQRDPRTPAH
jgi:hypothetical protein